MWQRGWGEEDWNIINHSQTKMLPKWNSRTAINSFSSFSNTTNFVAEALKYSETESEGLWSQT